MAGTGPVITGAKARAKVVMQVPEQAKVFLVNQEMTLTGTTRNYSTPELQVGQKYAIPIRVEVQRDGEVLEATATQTVLAGQSLELKVELDDGGKLQILSVGARVPSIDG
jgi:uncharacterized protein (TIGR03000 family)